MVARKALLLFSIVLLWAVWQAARINAAASPPDLLSPRPIHECLTLEGDPAPCHDDEIRTLDASIDGRVVSFASGGNRFVPADTNGFTDIFVWQDGSVQRVSVGANGEQTNHDSDIAAISGNGRYVFFRSRASTLISGTVRGNVNLYVKEVSSGRVALISRDRDGAPVNDVNISTSFTHIDADFSGRYVVFSSILTNMAEGIADINAATDIFLADLDPDGNGDYFDSAAQITLLSATADNSTVGDRASFEPFIAQDGSAVVWLTRATNLVPELASNGAVVDVLRAKLGKLPDGSIDPTTRTFIAINRMGDDAGTLTPQGARLARIDPWRDQVAFVTGDDIPGSGDDHAGEDLYLSVASGNSNDGSGERKLVWVSHAYSTSAPLSLSMAWDPVIPPSSLSQVAWVAQNSPRPFDDLLIQRSAAFHPPGWAAVNWLEASTPSSAAVIDGQLSADGRFAFWTTTEPYGLDVPPDSINLFRRQIAPDQLVPLTVHAPGGGAIYTPAGVPVNGTMHFTPTMIVTLTPRADIGYRFREWVGVDARAGLTATVIVYGARTVTGTFDAMTPPIASNLLLTTSEETPLHGISLTITDPDPDESHTVSLAEPPSHGTAAVVNNLISYQPAQDFSGQDEFALQVVDAYGLQLAMPVQVTIQVMAVNDAPSADDLMLTVAEDTLLSGITLDINDPDIGDSHTLTLVEGAKHGTVTILEGAATYLPASNFNGEDGFRLQVTDSGGAQLASPAAVTIQVTPVNDAPTAASARGSGINNGAPIPLLVTVEDPDAGDSYTLAVETPPAAGSVEITEQTQAQFFEYTPAAGFSGVESFTFRATDSANASIIGTAMVTVTLTMTPTPPPSSTPSPSPTPLPSPTPPLSPTLPLSPTTNLLLLPSLYRAQE